MPESSQISVRIDIGKYVVPVPLLAITPKVEGVPGSLKIFLFLLIFALIPGL